MNNPVTFNTLCQQLAVVLASMLVVFASQAQNSIEAVTGSVQGGSEVVRVEFSQGLKVVPHGFMVQSPARISLDFPGVMNAMGRTMVVVNQGNLKSINVLQSDERSRIVLNLKLATGYKTELQGNFLLVTLESSSAADNVTMPQSRIKLQVLPSLFDVGEGYRDNIDLYIFGGTGLYKPALSSDLGLAALSVTGNRLTVSLGTLGNRCIDPTHAQYQTGIATSPTGAASVKFVPVEFTVYDSFGASSTSIMRVIDGAGACP